MRTGGEIVRHERVEDTSAVVILCDVSGSMRGRKIERLRKELGRLWPEIRARLMWFADGNGWIDGPAQLPGPEGGTYLADALDRAATVFPSEVIVISDGLPESEDRALEAAARLPGIINVVFVGGDDDMRGAEFMRRLARAGGGVMVHKDLAKNLSIEGDLRGMLALPPPIAL